MNDDIQIFKNGTWEHWVYATTQSYTSVLTQPITSPTTPEGNFTGDGQYISTGNSYLPFTSSGTTVYEGSTITFTFNEPTLIRRLKGNVGISYPSAYAYMKYKIAGQNTWTTALTWEYGGSGSGAKTVDVTAVVDAIQVHLPLYHSGYGYVCKGFDIQA